jgi:lipid-binding SYLF domain-containing protein
MKSKKPVKKIVAGAAAGVLLMMSSLNIAAEDEKSSSPGADRIETSIEVLKEMVRLPEEGLPPVLLQKAFGVAVIPGVVKAAYGIGGQYGKGIILVRHETGSWGNPAFISIIGGSVGWQIGVQKADIVLVFKTRKSIDDIAEGKVTLGADIGVAAGPVGRSAEASTDLDMKAEIYSYSKSKGLFAGVSIKGASIQIDREANIAFYGKNDITANDILFGEDLKPPAVVEKLKNALVAITARSI